MIFLVSEITMLDPNNTNVKAISIPMALLAMVNCKCWTCAEKKPENRFSSKIPFLKFLLHYKLTPNQALISSIHLLTASSRFRRTLLCYNQNFIVTPGVFLTGINLSTPLLQTGLKRPSYFVVTYPGVPLLLNILTPEQNHLFIPVITLTG